MAPNRTTTRTSFPRKRWCLSSVSRSLNVARERECEGCCARSLTHVSANQRCQSHRLVEGSDAFEARERGGGMRHWRENALEVRVVASEQSGFRFPSIYALFNCSFRRESSSTSYERLPVSINDWFEAYALDGRHRRRHPGEGTLQRLCM